MKPASFQEPMYNRAKYVRLQIASDAPKVPIVAELSTQITLPPLPEFPSTLLQDMVSS